MNIRCPYRAKCAAAVVVSIIAGILLGSWNLKDAATPRADSIHVVHDAGQIFGDLTPRLANQFEVRNETNKAIQFIKKECTCTCTTTDLDKNLLQPGESGFFSMSLPTPANHSGKTSVRCELTFDDQILRVYSLSFESFPRSTVDRESIDLAEYDPASEEDHASTNADFPVHTIVDLFSPLGDPWPSLKDVKTPREFTTSIQGPPIQETFNRIKRTRYSVFIRPNIQEMKSLRSGSHIRTISFDSSDGTSTFTKVSWRIPSRFVFTPSPLYFGMLEPGTRMRSKSLRIQSVNHDPIHVIRVDSDREYLTVKQARPDQISGDGTLDLVLTLALPADDNLDEFLAGSVRLTLNNAVDVLDVPWSAVVRPGVPSIDETREPLESERSNNE